MKNKERWIILAAGICMFFGFLFLGTAEIGKIVISGDSAMPEVRKAVGRPLVCVILGSICLEGSFFYLSREKYVRLSQENERFTEIIKASDNLIFCLSDKNRTCRWYGNCEDFLGANDKTVDLESISHPDDFPIILQQLEDTGRGIVYSTETRIRDQSGGYETFCCRMVPVEKSGGGKYCVVGFLRKTGT